MLSNRTKQSLIDGLADGVAAAEIAAAIDRAVEGTGLIVLLTTNGGHSHFVQYTVQEVEDLIEGEEASVIKGSTTDAGHTHQAELTYDGTVFAVDISNNHGHSFEFPLSRGAGPNDTIVGAVFKTSGYHLEPAEQVVGNTGVAKTFDLSQYSSFDATLDDSPTITLTNPTAGASYFITLTQASGGSKTVTWAGAPILWAGGSSTLSTADGSVDVVVLVYNGAKAKFLATLNPDFQ